MQQPLKKNKKHATNIKKKKHATNIKKKQETCNKHYHALRATTGKYNTH
jgi:hypothetical protein